MKPALELSSKKNREGLYEIYIRVQDGNKKKRVKANLAVQKNQFKSKNHNLKWIINHPNHIKLNADLRKLLDEYEDVIFSSGVNKQSVSPETIIHKIKNSEESEYLVKFCKSKISLMDNYNHQKGYTQTLNNWLDYIESEKLGDLMFNQITVNIVKGFENFLRKKKLKESTIYTNLKRIRALFNQAIKEEVIEPKHYIFRAYTMPKASNAKKERLTIEELKLFSNADYEKGSLIKNVQQTFLLSFHLAGARVEDMLTLKKSYILKDRIEYTMDKTGAISSWKITPQMREILKYFKSLKSSTSFLLPFLDDSVERLANKDYKLEIGRKTSLLNKYLKKIAKDLCIEKTITNHIARHTFSSIAIKATGGNINFVKNALKHSSSKITEAYLLSLDNDSMDDEMAKVTSI
jgi:integrase